MKQRKTNTESRRDTEDTEKKRRKEKTRPHRARRQQKFPPCSEESKKLGVYSRQFPAVTESLPKTEVLLWAQAGRGCAFMRLFF